MIPSRPFAAATRPHALAAAIGALWLAGCATTMPVTRAPAPAAEAPIVATPPVIAPEPTPTTPVEPAPAGTAPVAPLVVAEGTQATGRDVFERIRARLGTPACVDSARAREWEDRYARHPAVFARKLEGVLPLLDFVVAETERSGLHGEFVFIPLVESWYEPGAIGRNGPAGMWQMIGTTARNHGVGMGKGYDGRLSPVESTRAALSYLKTLDRMFDGDWQATVMAYNAGEYRLAGALRRGGNRRVSAADGLPAGLSHITYDYVSKLQALSCLVSQPERHHLALPDDARFARLAPVLVDRRASTLEHVAVRAQVPLGSLRAWNPAYRDGRIADGVPRVLLMPAESAARLAVAAVADVEPTLVAGSMQEDAPAPAAGGSPTHQVRSGDTLSDIARQYGLTLTVLRRLNGLGNRSMIRPGQVLRLVP
jgi:membrane-bound lytic murein transglycosylase D